MTGNGSDRPVWENWSNDDIEKEVAIRRSTNFALYWFWVQGHIRCPI